ncbi:hypothetical protein MHOL44478_14820 [Mycobacterium holsaticum DSM 44478]|nr:hypothetical protein [Mycolicibacterium holsaticum DSM 44478 = JCM 12374]
MDLQLNRACVWCGPVFVVLFLIGFWVVGGFVPPPSPAWEADRMAEFFIDNAMPIRVGMLICASAAILIVPWAAAVSVQLKRIEGRFAVLGPCQLIGAGMSTLVFEYILFFWVAATFRAERSAPIIQAVVDLGWIPFVGLAGTAILQAVAIGVAILADKRAVPILPRWAGYANLWCALMFTPGTVNVFFKDGPLAWNGLISWYMVLVAFCIWFLINTHVVIKALSLQETRTVSPQPTGPSDELDRLKADIAVVQTELERLVHRQDGQHTVLSSAQQRRSAR